MEQKRRWQGCGAYRMHTDRGQTPEYHRGLPGLVGFHQLALLTFASSAEDCRDLVCYDQTNELGKVRDVITGPNPFPRTA
jgi:hypothetical protein